jgi:2-keto-4-pentenoate hydratase/2-oxohepta-3-ene-1,7-dioic acid hydratase in catechol pathway
MKLITFRTRPEAAARCGAVVGDMVVDLQALGRSGSVDLPASMQEFIELGPAAWSAATRLLRDRANAWPVGSALPLGNVTVLAPIPRPRKNIFGIGLNYVEHVAEASKALDTPKDLPDKPVIFSKPPTSVIGPNEAIQHDAKVTKQLDWEVELAIVMGRTARRVTKETALNYVFGYSIVIDISARDNRRAGQWIVSKGQDTYAPFGPCIVTADEIPDPQSLDLWLSVNGVEKQRSNTRHMLFNCVHLIADIASVMTLEPGDIIATGTPSGVGAGRTPQEWLWPGDVVVAEIAGIGRLRHPVVAI